MLLDLGPLKIYKIPNPIKKNMWKKGKCVCLVNKLMWLILTNRTKAKFDMKEEEKVALDLRHHPKPSCG